MKNVVVIGANGAIGSAFVSSYINDSNIENIFSLGRAEIKHSSNKIKHFIADITDESAVANFACSLAVSYTHLTLPTN